MDRRAVAAIQAPGPPCAVGTRFQPASEVATRLFNQRRFVPQFRRDEAFKREAALVDEAVVFHLSTAQQLRCEQARPFLRHDRMVN